ncbi:RNA-binding cell elongation regulator Jag/EloR [Priestia koreensis]|uniref:RNA-binding cell elongation regulator Jag/EloR n=1 Tax=Priestia koreensis TaxID=284581 RepID=UPI003CFEEAB4
MFTGRTVEEATQNGLKQLGLNEDQVILSVIDEGKKGFLGVFNKKPAVIEMKRKIDPVQEAEEYLQRVIMEMGITADLTKKVQGRDVEFLIHSTDAFMLIGKRGGTVNALELLTQLVANRFSTHYINIKLNPEGYREKRKQSLEVLAGKLAAKALQSQSKVELEPMNSSERKILHQALVRNKSIRTYSVGTEPNRHLVIEPLQLNRRKS